MAPKASSEDTQLRGYRYRLSPNRRQTTALLQMVGASRVAYNMLVGHNRDAQQRRRNLHDELVASGVDDTAAWDQVKTAAKDDESLRLTTSYQQFGTEILTPEVTRHRDAAARIAAGEPAEKVWPDTERYAQPWLHTVPRRVLVSGLQDAAKAFRNYFDSLTGKRAGRPAGFPRFKKKGKTRDSYTLPRPEAMGPKDADGGKYHRAVDGRTGPIADYHHLRLANLGVIRVEASTKRLVRALRRGAEIRSFTVSEAAGYWYVSLLVAEPSKPRAAATRRQRAGGAVGIDLGVSTLMSFDNGDTVANPRLLARDATRIARTQRHIARAVPGSANHQRLKKRLARHQHRLAQRRNGLIHEITTDLTNNTTMIGIEDLNVAGMTASAKGTVDNPGRNVAAKSGLNRAILDAAFGQIRTQLGYKTAERGVDLVVIDRYFPSSQTCSQCSSKTKITLATRTYRCSNCGMVLDRDVNAARNIINLALTMRGEQPKYGRPGTGTTLNGRGVNDPAELSSRTEEAAADVEAARLTAHLLVGTESRSRATDCPSPTTNADSPIMAE